MRLQRWVIILSAFNYSIRFVPSKQNTVTDSLTRLAHLLPITHKEIRYATRVGPVLFRALEFVKQGWPQHVEDLQPFLTAGLSYRLSKIVFWGPRVIIPTRYDYVRKTCWKSSTQVTQAMNGWRKWLAVTYGGRTLIRKLNKLWGAVAAVNKLENHPQWLL